MSNVRRATRFALLALLSVIIPLAVIAWSVYSFWTSAVEPFESATLKNDEMWYIEYRAYGGLWNPDYEYVAQLKCRNLTTGIEREVPLKTEPDYDYSEATLWAGDDLYVISPTEIYKRSVDSLQERERSSQGAAAPGKPTGAAFQLFTKRPVNIGVAANLQMSVFLYHGELTTVVECQEGGYRLMHFHDGRWIDGRKIRLPPTNCVWFDNPDDGRKMLLPTPSQAGVYGLASPTIVSPATSVGIVNAVPIAAVGSSTLPTASTTAGPTTFAIPWIVSSMRNLQIVQCGDNVHIYCSTDTGFSAYRCGLEFDDETTEGVSALAAENSIREANGWEPIPASLDNGEWVQQMACDRDGALFTTGTGRVFRRSLDGQWSLINGLENQDDGSIARLIVDSSNDTLYVASATGAVGRIDGNSISSANFRLPDVYGEYLARWQRLRLSLVGAWLLHFVLVTGGAGLFTRYATQSSYEFGVQKVDLASTRRRCVALTIDLVMFVSLLFVSFCAHSWFLGMTRTTYNQKELFASLSAVESNLLYNGWQSFAILVDSLTLVGNQADFSSQGPMVPIVVLIDTGFVLWLLKVYDEGRFGITPGKWLLGIRTLRTTLRPCGFARCLARDVLYWIDLLAFLSPLPAAASMMFSTCRQRCGDRVADTIVVKANSIVER